MNDPQYIASGGVIFQREHIPMTLLSARIAVSIHRRNASRQITESDKQTLPARLAVAKVEMALADELEAAIAEITQPKERSA